MLRLVAASAAAGVPAATILDAWAEDSRGGQGTRLERAAGLLRQGATVSEAATRVPGLIQDDHATALAFGERIGLLGPVVQAALAGDELLDPTPRRGLQVAIRYLAVMVVLFLLVAGFISIRVYPMLKKVMDDQGVDLPGPTTLLIEGLTWLSNYWWIVGVVLMPVIIIRLFPPAWRGLTRPLARRRRITAAIDALSVADACGRQIPEAASALADCQADPAIARRLRKAAAPGPLGHHLAAAGFIAANEAAVIDSAGSDRAAALERLAKARRDCSRRRLIAVGDAVGACVVFTMGGLVLLQSLAVMSCLCTLIESLS
jgi:hypothetical protein